MDAKLIQHLQNQEQLASLPSGEKGVRVTLQYQPRLNQPTLAARRSDLRDRFAHVAAEFKPAGVCVDLDAISITGQTVNAIVPLDKFDAIEQSLNERSMRVDVSMDRQIV